NLHRSGLNLFPDVGNSHDLVKDGDMFQNMRDQEIDEWVAYAGRNYMPELPGDQERQFEDVENDFTNLLEYVKNRLQEVDQALQAPTHPVNQRHQLVARPVDQALE